MECVIRQVTKIEEERGEEEKAIEKCREAIRSHVTMIRNLLATHHKLMSDVRSILKTMAKVNQPHALK